MFEFCLNGNIDLILLKELDVAYIFYGFYIWLTCFNAISL